MPERLEDVRQMLLGYPDAGVSYAHPDLAIVWFHDFQTHLAAIRVLHRIPDEIEEDLASLVGIRVRNACLVRQRQMKLQPARDR